MSGRSNGSVPAAGARALRVAAPARRRGPRRNPRRAGRYRLRGMTVRPSSARPRVLAVLAALLLLMSVVPAQKPGKDYYEDPAFGYRFKPPRGWDAVPVKPELERLGVAALFKGEPISVSAENFAGVWQPDLYVYVIAETGATGGKEASGPHARLETASAAVVDRIAATYVVDFRPNEPVVDEDRKVKKLTARHSVWNAGFPTNQQVTLPITIDVWSFSLGDRDVSLVFTMLDQRYRKWAKTFQGVAKTFSEIERRATISLDSDAGYADLLRFHEAEAARVPGWRVLPTDSRRFIVKTSSDNEKLVEATIERLERSRDLFERDFPPREPIEAVSVVRICASEEEFRRYGQTPPGVVGWFNRVSTELVLFDSSDVDRKESYAVMTHEAFHQYCFFLFDRARAHRWFDEGHGDYYGGFEFKGDKAFATARMPGDLDRLEVVRGMLRRNEWVPIEEHVNYDATRWRAKGVASYAQSWSIVYMLRQGMLGQVSRRVWKDEYAEIIPNYVAALQAGFQDAYAARHEEARKEGREIDAGAIELDPAEEDAIRKTAIDESWGRIDIDAFEKDWLEYIDKFLDG